MHLIKRLLTTGLLLVALLPIVTLEIEAHAESNETSNLPETDWTFTGLFGRYNDADLRRGFLVYMDACSTCHSLRHVAYRDLKALGVGFGPEDLKTIAAQFKVVAGPDDDGKMFKRPARPSDRFVPPYPNVQAAKAANKGMLPTDLSLITKARPGGPDFLYHFLTGYADAPADFDLAPGMYYNSAVSGHQTGMMPPLYDDLVLYDDGTDATVEQMSKDVTQFLAWAGDPHMDQRKRLGVKVVIFLALLTIMLIALKKEVWAHLRQRPQHSTE